MPDLEKQRGPPGRLRNGRAGRRAAPALHPGFCGAASRAYHGDHDPAGPADDAAIAANNRATALETEGWEIGRDTALAGARAILEEPCRGFYLVAADADGAVVGQCMVTYEWSDWRSGDFWWVQSVYVRPDCRRQGIFARLYRTVEAMAEARPDVTGLRLYVEARNATAQAAYERLGMRPAPYVLLERDYAKKRADRA